MSLGDFRIAKPTVPSPSRYYDPGNEAAFRQIFDRFASNVVTALGSIFPKVTDATRPAPGTAGRVVFNVDDGNLNIDDGTDWILPDGTVVT